VKRPIRPAPALAVQEVRRVSTVDILHRFMASAGTRARPWAVVVAHGIGPGS